MPSFVDYLVAREGWPEKSGMVSDYVLGRTGLFLATDNANLSVRMQLAYCLVRGLGDIQPEWTLNTGKLPAVIWTEMIGIAQAAAMDGNEVMMAVTADEWGQFHLVVPAQEAGPSHVRVLEPVAGAVLEVHSHCRYGAYFSGTDDKDEQGLRLYGVMGHVTTNEPKVVLRLGAWGYFMPVRFDQVFEASPAPFVDVNAVIEEDIRQELEVLERGLHGGSE